MAITNPNITPEDGLHEGDLFELKFYALDPDGANTDFDVYRMLVRSDGGDTVVIPSTSFQSGNDVDGNYILYNHVVGPHINQFQLEATGLYRATALCHIKATRKPLTEPS